MIDWQAVEEFLAATDPPEVFARQQRRKLRKRPPDSLGRRCRRNSIRAAKNTIWMAHQRGLEVADIADLVCWNERRVRNVIRRFEWDIRCAEQERLRRLNPEPWPVYKPVEIPDWRGRGYDNAWEALAGRTQHPERWR